MVAYIPFKIEILENVSNSCVPKRGICRIAIAALQLRLTVVIILTNQDKLINENDPRMVKY
jgi:hypothetical protein